MSDPLQPEQWGGNSNLPDEEYVVPEPITKPTAIHLSAIDQEATDIATGELNKVMESLDYYHTPDKGSGKLFDFKPMVAGIRKDYEYLVEGLLRAGTNVLSGPRGAGKTSFLAPFVCAVGGLVPHYPMDIKLRRRVIMFTEDRAQLTRLFDSMINDGYMDVTHEELNRWVHVSDAERISTDDIAEHAEELERMVTPNLRADGGTYPAYPLVVFDTLSAGIDLEDIDKNSEVSKEIAKMRDALDGKASLLLVGHTAKDAGRKVQTMLGAQAWEANTIGSITLRVNGEGRYMEITKDRFAAPVKRFNVRPIRTSCSGIDVLGHPTTIHDLYSELVPMSEEQAGAVKETEKAALVECKLKEDTDALMSKLTEMLNEHDPDGSLRYPDGVKKGDLYAALPRKETVYRPIIKALKDKKIEVNEEGSADLITIKTDKEVV